MNYNVEKKDWKEIMDLKNRKEKREGIILNEKIFVNW